MREKEFNRGNNSNYSRFLIRNHGGQKEVVTFYKGWGENSGFYTQRKYSSENERKTKTLSDEGKLRESFVNRPILKKLLKEVSETERKQ